MMLLPSLGISDDVEFAFNPLDVPTQKERADTFKIVSEGLAKLIEFGVLSPMEARTMFKGEELKLMPTLDEKSAALLAEIGEQENGETSEPSEE